MRYLDLDEVLRIHEHAVRQYGGSPGIRDIGLLESALATPKQTMFGEDLYPDVVLKAAVLVYLLVKNHPFVDGNKRTGFLCLMRFLAINGYTLIASNDELYQVTMDTATSGMDKDTLGGWIRARLQKVEHG